jgi:hypothetical protein
VYSEFPGIHQAVEITSHVKEIRKGEVTKDTTTVCHAVTDYSPREVGAAQLDRLARRHWMAENRNHYVGQPLERRPRHLAQREGGIAMFLFVSISLNLLRTTSPRWTDATPMTQRSMAADYAFTVAPQELVSVPP